MRSRDQVIWDFVQGWLRKAENDLEVAQALMAGAGEYGQAVGFHCQQAAEKFMKAFLVRHQMEFPKTHDLEALRGLIGQSDEKLAEALAFVDWLTPFGVEARYPGTIPDVERGTAQRAITDAERARRLVRAALQDYLSTQRPG